MKLVVGLGNPDSPHLNTRHNAGFWFIEALARRLGVTLVHKARFHGAIGRLGSGGTALWLLQPSTWMNLSGRSVAALAGYYRIAPSEILIAHDEIDIAPGCVRLKHGGGAAGHNGLRDIIKHLGDQAFWRLRLGVGHPGHAAEVVSYVLRPPPATERAAIEGAIDLALGQFDRITAGVFDEAMNVLHGPAAAEPKAGAASTRARAASTRARTASTTVKTASTTVKTATED